MHTKSQDYFRKLDYSPNIGGCAVSSTSNAGPLNLGLAAPFAIIARASITDANPSVINGDVGLAPGSSQGIPPFEINGSIHINDATVAAAQADLQAAFIDGAMRTGTPIANLAGMNLAPGVYTSATSMLLSGGNLTLTGGPSDVWIFNIGTTLTQVVGSNMILAGGALASNVFWVVGSSTTIGSGCAAVGSFMSAVSSTIVSGATVDGRVFAGSNGNVTGAVTIDANTISVPGSVVSPPAWANAINSSLVTYSALNRLATKKVSAGDIIPAVVLSKTSHASGSGGKWYAEITLNSMTFSLMSIGVATSSVALNNVIGADVEGWGWANNTAIPVHNAIPGAPYGAPQAVGTVIGLKLDLTAFTLELLANNVSMGVAPATLSAISGIMHVAGAISFGTTNDSLIIATQAADFNFAIPAGYAAWG